MNVCTSSEMLAILSSAKNTCIVHKWQSGSPFFPIQDGMTCLEILSDDTDKASWVKGTSIRLMVALILILTFAAVRHVVLQLFQVPIQKKRVCYAHPESVKNLSSFLCKISPRKVYNSSKASAYVCRNIPKSITENLQVKKCRQETLFKKCSWFLQARSHKLKIVHLQDFLRKS